MKHELKKGGRHSKRFKYPQINPIYSNNISPVERIVANGPLDGSVVKLKTRPRDNRPCDQTANNDFAIEIYLKIPKKRLWTRKLSKFEGWEDNCDYLIKKRDTWIDPDDPNARTLMKLFADSLILYVDWQQYRKSSINNPEKVFDNISRIMDKLEHHILSNKDLLVKNIKDPTTQLTSIKVLNESGIRS
jgi:hypothetical protein